VLICTLSEIYYIDEGTHTEHKTVIVFSTHENGIGQQYLTHGTLLSARVVDILNFTVVPTTLQLCEAQLE